MIIYPCDKVYHGIVSVRSFIVERAKKTKQTVRIEHENGYMMINGDTPYEITAPPQIAQRTDKYIRKGKPYELYDFAWNPIVEQTDYTVSGLTKLRDAMSKVFSKKEIQTKII